AVFHNKPAPTFRIRLKAQEMVATGIHRFWNAGKGWTMTRELKPGDVLRTLGGVADVLSVMEDRVQPVFNLPVAAGASYFVANTGARAHDNSTIDPVGEPFAAVGRFRPRRHIHASRHPCLAADQMRGARPMTAIALLCLGMVVADEDSVAYRAAV